MRDNKFLLLIVLLFGACNSAAPKKQTSALQYFDLKGYMEKEVKRLKQMNPEIDKTVMVNNAEEHRKLKITDWQKELSAFSDADINKSAWEELFKLHKAKDSETYLSDNDKVPVKSLVVEYRNGRIYKIEVLNSNSNTLYTSNDTLSYFPDSLYEIRKTQHIRLLNGKNYRITGRFH
ncbi:hypothetical protein [Pedobacter hartonius]|uniref:Uncharacterized protein n=1 Tax=Pedobacter hartonius TaxID=425514 RepID=A0A1H3XPC1_9SPHI|nr:hypothetical protein [Pedobacter hartonius]SEA01229.1 hypothetical protein SAMN05443550_101684 [Pedobacter hartonius]